MNSPLKFPFYAKGTVFFIGLYVFINVLYVGQGIILPLVYAIIIAILISPVVNFLVRKKINRAVAITGVLLIAFLVSAGLIALIASQASLLRAGWPHLLSKLQDLLSQTITWASGFFNIYPQKINTWITTQTAEFFKNQNAGLGNTLSSMGGVLSAAVLVPVYIFMILFYQPHLIGFIHKVFGADNDANVTEILTETKIVVQGYLVGLFAEFVIIAILNSAGLLVLRIDYAILLGIIGALLNVIPIVGGIVCVALFVVIALLTKSPVYVLYVVGLYALIQFIDDHFIFPKIVGSKVKLNALISIIAVIAGDALWGIPGMFLSIPLIAIIKVILDRIEPLKPWGFLLGVTVPASGEINSSFTLKTFVQRFTSKKN
jgi:predicted PurR-regulated permease PerM